MSLPNELLPIGLLGATTGGYQISRSLRFNSIDSAYLSRVFGTPTDAKKQTYSFWIKRSNLGQIGGFERAITNAYTSGSTATGIYLGNDSIQVTVTNAGDNVRSTALFRDVSAWYHFVVSVDTTQATAANRVRIYVNGAEITQFASASYPALNSVTQFANSSTSRIGTLYNAGGYWYDGLIAEFHFIDGQALDPTSFGEFDLNGIWQPKPYGGTFGTNGFKLDFADNSSNTATTLGKDTSGNGNNFTPNNLSVTAGAGNDSLVDSPTNYGTDTGVGGEVRGNYATWNPLAKNGIYNSTLSNGNLDSAASGDARTAWGTIAIPSSGKWYFEVTTTGSPGGPYVGIAQYTGISNAYPQDSYGPSVTYYGFTGQRDITGSYSAYGATYSNATIGVAVNADSSQITFYKDGVSQGVINQSVVGGFPFVSTSGGSGVFTLNAGQRPFAYTAPSGFKALCTANLPAPTITKPSSVFDVKLYTGNGGTQTISGLGFSPDLVWLKARSYSFDNVLYDTVRGSGTTKSLSSNISYEEGFYSNNTNLTSFDSNGFTLGTTAGINGINYLDITYVAWTWDAGSSTVTNTSGSITSSVRANASAGFSIVTYTSNGTNGTSVGHGLGVKPALVIQKNRTSASDWLVLTQLIDGSDDYLLLNSTAAAATAAAGMTSTTFGSWDRPNGNSMVAYCFAPVAGYSSMGSYVGNGSSDGPFVFCNFRPKYLLYKRSDSANAWVVFDSVRGTYNLNTPHLQPHLSSAESDVSTYGVDFLSNGFKLRSTDASMNASGGTYVYACFAESPFSLARAR